MAAAIRQQSKVILSRARCIEQNLRNILTGRCLLGNTWHIFDKHKKKREFPPVEPLVEVDKTPEADLKPIIIPDKIERSPTAILEALASLVKNDTNQPMYKSIDDPFLYLDHDSSKKHSMAAMDSGRKAARMMMSMYPDYITQIWEEPLPEVWRDSSQGYVHKEPSEAALLERIAKRNVVDAIQVYEAVNPKSQFSQDTLEKFIELLSVFNSQSPDKQSDLQFYIDMPVHHKTFTFPPNSWTKNNIAEQVFKDLPVKTCRAYCYLIRGMAGHFYKAGAMNLYKEMKAANMIADVITFNELLSVASLDLNDMDDVMLEIETLLKDMAANDVKPNLQTFNSILLSCSRVYRWAGCKKFALSVLAEMKALGIEPSLATYDLLLKITYSPQESTPQTKNADLFIEILKDVEIKEFQLTSEIDTFFFRSAMKVITTHLPDSKLALHLHKIFTTGQNSNFLGHRFFHYAYFSELFSLLAQLEHTDVVMSLYQPLCPFMFVASSEIYRAFLDNISLHDTFHYIPQIYTDIQRLSYFNDKTFLLAFVKVMAHHKHEAKLQGQMCDIVQALLEKWTQKQDRLKQLPAIDGEVIGHMIIIYLNNDNVTKAWELFDLYKKTPSLRKTSPCEKSLQKLTETLISVQDYNSAKTVMETMLVLDHDGIPQLVETCLEMLQLPEKERSYLEGLARNAPASDSTDSSSSSGGSGSSSGSDSDEV